MSFPGEKKKHFKEATKELPICLLTVNRGEVQLVIEGRASERTFVREYKFMLVPFPKGMEGDKTEQEKGGDNQDSLWSPGLPDHAASAARYTNMKNQKHS